MNKDDIEKIIIKEFTDTEWCMKSVAKLPRAFVRHSNITPFFQPRVVRMSGGQYSIDGYIGFIDQEFEKLWQRESGCSINSHCLALNIANFDALQGKQELSCEMNFEIHRFCRQIKEFLASLPASYKEALHAFETGVLLQRPLSKFEIFGREEKVRRLKDFIRSRVLH